jgi:hypothetical protein
MNTVGYFGFACSFALLGFISIRAAWALGSSAAERFWIAVAAAALQLGTLGTFLSLLGYLTPTGWLIAQGGLAVFAWLVFHPRLHAPPEVNPALAARPQPATSRWGQGLGVMIAGLLVLALALSAVQQALTPIWGFDERMYHASRVLYWIENRSLLPYVTHNDRQVVFPFGSELFFAWPVLFTRAEVVGRMVFWVGLPLSALGMFTLMRELRLSRMTAAVWTLLFGLTPTIVHYAVALKPALWAATFVLGTGFWLLRAYQAPRARARALGFAGLFATLSVNAHATALALWPPLLLAALLLRQSDHAGWPRFRAAAALLAGLTVGVLGSGLAVTLTGNWRSSGHPFGSQALRAVHHPDFSLRQVYTHAVRVPFFLFELPQVPAKEIRQPLEAWGNQLVERLGAGQPLPLEGPGDWPGYYSFEVNRHATRYSLLGLLWCPMLAAAAVGVGITAARCGLRYRPSPGAALVVLLLPYWAAVVFLVRWINNGPERYWIPPFALAVPIMAWLLARARWDGRVSRGLTCLLAGWVVWCSLHDRLLDVKCCLQQPFVAAWADGPFIEVLPHLPAGSCVLLVGHQDACDYPLFAPWHGYANRVVSWGKVPFDPARMRQMIDEHRVTHVVIQDDVAVGFQWHPWIATAPMVSWLSAQPGMREVPLQTPHQRLFVTGYAADAPAR